MNMELFEKIRGIRFLCAGAIVFFKGKMVTGIIFALLATGVPAWGQGAKWSITGKALDRQTGEAVEYANVLLYSAGDSALASHATTAAGGVFALEHNSAGEYYLMIGSIGFEKKRVALRLTESQKDIALGDILLEPSQTELSAVEVVGRKRQIVYKLDRRVIEASGFLSAAGGTAVDILAQTPSIRVDAEGEVTFRGSSGFKVYIDGKPSSLEGTAALEQIPAGQIENIEVITVPSARNDADGAAGIININTGKQNMDGWSGMVNVMGSTALSRNVDFLVALRQKDVRWQVSGEASRRFLNSDFDQMKTITTPERITTDHSTGDRVRHTDVYSLRAGLDRYRDNTTWTAAVEAGYRDRWRGGDLHYEDTYRVPGQETVTADSFNGDDYVHLYEWNLRGDAGFDHRFAKAGHKLTGALYALYQGNAMEYFETNLCDMAGVQVQGHKAWEYEYRFTAQANVDYVLPLDEPENKVEAGYQYFSYTEDGDYRIDMFDAGVMDFVQRDDLYSQYLFRRDVHALYAMWSDSRTRVSYQLGLRGEYTYCHLGSNEEWARHTRHRFGLFPSVHAALDLTGGGRTSLAYSRRITQPQLFYMEPYVVYVDYYTAQRGNPSILPEYTNSVEWSYNKSFGNNTLTGTLFFRARKDKIERVRVPYHTGVTLDSMANVGNDYASGAELSATLQLKKWWNLDANGSLYDYRIRNEYKVDGKDEKSLNWQLSVSNNIDLAKNTRMRLEAYYVGPSVSTQGRIDDFFYMNLTVRQQLLRRRLTASLSVRDLLATARYNSTQSNINVESLTGIVPQAPVVTLTLAYTFNNFKSQKKEEKNTHDLFEGTNR
jgi:outer membrane receptor protein involved in Fe transport